MLKLKEIRIEHSPNFTVTDNPAPRFTVIADGDESSQFSAGLNITVTHDDEVFWDYKSDNGETANIVYAGKKLLPCKVYSVKATVVDNNNNKSTKTASFETGKMGDAWTADWITHPFYKLGLRGNPVPFVFKKCFSAPKKIKSARIYATAMGVYTATVNGKRVGDSFLAPGYTSYKNNLYYQVYDITDMLTLNNEVLFTVAGGWACGEFGLLKQNKASADKPSLLAEIKIDYSDNSTEIFSGGTDWLVTDEGPVRDASIYDGESVDARMSIEFAHFVPASKAKMRFHTVPKAQYGVLPHPVETLVPVSSFKSKDGIIYDFGQNFAGVVLIRLNAHAGQVITVRHAEVLINNELFTRPLRTAKAQFRYICRDGEQEYCPEYTYMGFRYIEVRGAAANDIQISAKVLSSAAEETGTFICSNDDINRLQQNIRWGGRSNFVSIPTDCPQRDERLGWTGDIAVFASTACFNFNMSPFLEEWLTDVASEQTPGGAIPVVVPHVRFLQKLITAGWSDCCVLVPWALYLSTGDITILERYYPMMKKYLSGVEKKSGLLSAGEKKYIWNLGFSYGDWCAPDEKQLQWMRKKKWISTAYFANSCSIASKIADILGNTADKEYYRELNKKIVSAYRNTFTDKSGKLHREFQTAYVCPLYFGMTDGAETNNYAKNLAELVDKADNHLTTGFLGTPYLLFALSDNGYSEKAYDVLLQDTCPGWLYEVKAGGTTVWERWDALRPDGTVNLGEGAVENSNTAYGGGMVSFNHYANGAVGDWLYRRVAGIEQLTPGYKKFTVRPVTDKRLTFVRCEKKTPYGTIISEWHCDNKSFKFEVTVPFNTTAEIVLPDNSSKTVNCGKHCFEFNRKGGILNEKPGKMASV